MPSDNQGLPLAYLITFRSYGTWLHGDKRGSISRFCNRYGTPVIPHNAGWQRFNEAALTQPEVKLLRRQRGVVEAAIRETCRLRKWGIWAINVRTNHIHIVVSALCKPEKILAAFKANATRKLKETGYWNSKRSPWIDGGSKKYLWTESDVINAVVYVEYEQGPALTK